MGAFALCESVLPQAFAALRRWRRQQAKKEGKVGTQLPSANAKLAKTDVANDARALEASSCAAQATRPSAASAPRAPTVQSVFVLVDAHPNEEAQRLWEAAQEIPHRARANFETDWKYMSLLHKAAKLGHAEACSTIGDYAYWRGTLVEAFFWKWKAEANGGKCVEPSLDEICEKCLVSGAFMELGELAPGYGVDEHAFAQAVIAVRSGIDEASALDSLKKLAEGGLEEARLFLAGR